MLPKAAEDLIAKNTQNRDVLFLSSANLTEHAFTRNMELGLLITGTDLPGQGERHFDQLIASQVLLPVAGD